MAQYPSPGAPEFLLNAADSARQLPSRLLDQLSRFRLTERESALLIDGLHVDDARIGPTPPDWQAAGRDAATRREEFLLVLVAETLGEVYGYASLQHGNLIHHLLPIAGQETNQSGHGSATELVWHTEDAFTPVRCDFLALMGLRNPDRVGTLFASRDVLDELSKRDVRVLCQPRFVVRADDEHLKHVTPAPPGARSIHHARERRRLVPILWGGPELPFLLIDKVYMEPRPGDTEATVVFNRAVALFDSAIHAVAVGPADILIVNNHRAVHGRAAFRAKYDGTDRWLLKVSITCDLNKSRRYRVGDVSRVIH